MASWMKRTSPARPSTVFGFDGPSQAIETRWEPGDSRTQIIDSGTVISSVAVSIATGTRLDASAQRCLIT
jgi:hypothetical protein